MKICFVEHIRFPTEKAHGLQIASMCQKLGDKTEVSLVVPSRINHIVENPFVFYKLNQSFTIKTLKTIDFFSLRFLPKRIIFFFNRLFFALRVLFYRFKKDTIIVTRSPEIAFVCSLRGFNTLFDAHNFPDNHKILMKFFLRKVKGIVCNSNGTASAFQDFRCSKLVLPNGVDLSLFNERESKEKIREKLNLPNQKFIITYTGHLYTWKGIDLFFETASFMQQHKDLIFLVVGGTKEDVALFQKKQKEKNIGNIIFLGFKNHELIPKYLKASDILVLPNVPTNKESVSFTSPIKMFEYMASEVPIVASDLSSIREVLDEQTSLLFNPSNVDYLCKSILFAFENYEDMKMKAKNAKDKVVQFSWDTRADKLINFINTICAES